MLCFYSFAAQFAFESSRRSPRGRLSLRRMLADVNGLGQIRKFADKTDRKSYRFDDGEVVF